MANVATLHVLLKARDQLSGPMDKAQGRMGKMTAAAKKMSVGLAGAGVALAGVGAALSIRAFAGFEQSMARAGALSSATSDELAQMTEVAKKMGRETQFSAKQAAGALSFLSQAGFKVEESTAALPGVLQLAAAAQLDLAKAADITSNVLTGYGLQVKDLSRVNDVLTKAFTSANTDLTQLGEALKLAGPIASAAGIRFEEATAALALMGNAGIQASMAGTSLRGAITRLLNPTASASKLLDQMGVRVTDAKGDMLPFVDIIRTLESANLSAADAMTIFGQRAGPALLALIGQGSDALVDFTAKLDTSGGTAQRIADLQMATLQGALTKLKSATEGLAIAVGTILAPMIVKLAGLLQSVAGFLAKFIDRMGTTGTVMRDTTKAIAGINMELNELEKAFAAAALSADELRRAELQLQSLTLAKQIDELLKFNEALLARPQRDRFKQEIEDTIRQTTRLLHEQTALKAQINVLEQSIADGLQPAFEKLTPVITKSSESIVGWGERFLATQEVVTNRTKEAADQRIAAYLKERKALGDFGFAASMTLRGIEDAQVLTAKNTEISLAIMTDAWEQLQGGIENTGKKIERTLGDLSKLMHERMLDMAEDVGEFTQFVNQGISAALQLGNIRAEADETGPRVLSAKEVRRSNLQQEIRKLGAEISQRGIDINKARTQGVGAGGLAEMIGFLDAARARQHGLIQQLNDFGHGGVVPGAMGAPMVATVHGGERILTPKQQGGMTLNLTVQGDVLGMDDLENHVLRIVRDAKAAGGLPQFASS